MKNKVAPPFKQVSVDIIYGKGIVRENELFNIAVEDGIMTKKGSWFYYTGDDGTEYSLGQGRNSAISFLKENKAISDEIEKKVRKNNNLLKSSEPSTDDNG